MDDWNIYEVAGLERVAVLGGVSGESALTPADAVALFLKVFPELTTRELVAARD